MYHSQIFFFLCVDMINFFTTHGQVNIFGYHVTVTHHHKVTNKLIISDHTGDKLK